MCYHHRVPRTSSTRNHFLSLNGALFSLADFFFFANEFIVKQNFQWRSNVLLKLLPLELELFSSQNNDLISSWSWLVKYKKFLMSLWVPGPSLCGATMTSSGNKLIYRWTARKNRSDRRWSPSTVASSPWVRPSGVPLGTWSSPGVSFKCGRDNHWDCFLFVLF